MLASLNYKKFCCCGRARYHFKWRTWIRTCTSLQKFCEAITTPGCLLTVSEMRFEVEIPHLLIWLFIMVWNVSRGFVYIAYFTKPQSWTCTLSCKQNELGICQNIHIWALADPRGVLVTLPLPGPISFFFTQFSRKKCPNNRLVSPYLGLVPPPLFGNAGICHCWVTEDN